MIARTSCTRDCTSAQPKHFAVPCLPHTHNTAFTWQLNRASVFVLLCSAGCHCQPHKNRFLSWPGNVEHRGAERSSLSERCSVSGCSHRIYAHPFPSRTVCGVVHCRPNIRRHVVGTRTGRHRIGRWRAVARGCHPGVCCGTASDCAAPASLHMATHNRSDMRCDQRGVDVRRYGTLRRASRNPCPCECAQSEQSHDLK